VSTDSPGHCYTTVVLPRFTRGAFVLFAISFLGSMLLGDLGFAHSLRLDAAGVAVGDRVWQLLSSLFVYPDRQLAALAITLLVQWILGGQLEEFWGTKRFLVMAAVSGIVGNAAVVVLALAIPSMALPEIGGSAPFDMAVAVAFTVAYGRQTFRPVASHFLRGRTVGLLGGVLILVAAGSQMMSGAAEGGLWVLLLPLVVSGGVALLFVTQPWQSNTGQRGGAVSKPSDRSHLRVVRNADDLLN